MTRLFVRYIEEAGRNPGSMAHWEGLRPWSADFLGTLSMGVAFGNHYMRANTCSDRLCSGPHYIGSMSPVMLLGLAAVARTATGQGATGERLACLGSLSIELMSGLLPGSRSSGLGRGPYL